MLDKNIRDAAFYICRCLHSKYYFAFNLILLFFSKPFCASSQTPTDGLMMSKGKVCNVISYTHDNWKHYWEGSLKRENLNIGTVTSQNVMYMGAFGVTKNLNLMVALPYIWTKASAGTLQGKSGIQDLMVDLKYKPIKVAVPFGNLSLIGVLGFSTPLSNYTKDYLPLSIGLGSTTGYLRGIMHYQTEFGAFLTFQGGYLRRNNIKIEKSSYYTDKMHYTSEVFMPDAYEFSPRIGFLSPDITAEIYLNRFQSLGATDIRRNDMPFPSNRMEATKIGGSFQYRFDFFPGLGVLAGGSYVLKGRNMGKSSSITAGVTYIFSAWNGNAGKSIN